MDKNEFFREATLQICSHLNLERAVQACAEYLKGFMPVDFMSAEVYDPEFHAMRGLACVWPTSSGPSGYLVPVGPEFRPKMREAFDPGTIEPLYIINDVSAIPQAVNACRLMKLPTDSSAIWVRLHAEGQFTGGIGLLAKGRDRYTEEHGELVSLLREPFTVAVTNAVRHREVQRLEELLRDDNRYLQRELLLGSGQDVVGADFGLSQTMHAVRQVASHNSPVLLLGETGVGKDVLANYIHQISLRATGPMIKVNCGAIPEALIDSELFGHEKGAFTGALAQKRGRFERAHEGTIFLDEVGELPQEAQVRLLRVLQNGELERVGGAETIEVDTRVIAATNKNLEQLVKEKKFRKDLFYRLSVFPITVPPLRERTVDIPALVEHFLTLKTKELKLGSVPKLAPGAMDTLTRYLWPGNVRELANVVERAIILNPDGPLDFEHLGLPAPSKTEEITDASGEIFNLDVVTKRHIERVLRRTEGKVHGPGGAAKLLGINPSTLRARMNKLGISYGKRGD